MEIKILKKYFFDIILDNLLKQRSANEKIQAFKHIITFINLIFRR